MKFEIDVFPQITFLLYSSTVKFKGYDLTNVPTSTGRADMLVRVIRNIIYSKNAFESKMGLVFFPNTTFLAEVSEFSGLHDRNAFLICSQSNYFQKSPFKISSEHELLNCFYESFLHLGDKFSDSLFFRTYSMNIYEYIDTLIENGIKMYLLHENGRIMRDFDETRERMSFLLGDQFGYNDLDLARLLSKAEGISLGATSYLGSSAVTLIKWMLWKVGII